MPTRSPVVASVRRSLLAFASLLIAIPALAAAPPAPTAARIQQAQAAWRRARGVDLPPEVRATLDRLGVLRAQGGGDPPDPQDDHWQAGFGLPAPDNFITTLVPLDGRLIAGGYFTSIGELKAPAVAAWDGAGWSALGDYPGIAAMDLAPYPGGLIAMDPYQLYRWDGATWSTLGTLPPDASNCLAMAVNGRQVALAVWASSYDQPGHVRVLLFNGSAWGSLAGSFHNAVNALAWYHDELYVGGSFDSVDTTPAYMVARWDGAAWQPVGSELQRIPYGDIRSFAVYQDQLVAGGSFLDADPTVPRFFARFDGTHWTALGDGPSDYPNVTRLRVLGTDLFALGQFHLDHTFGVARWDGLTWHAGEDSLQAQTFDIAEYAGDLYAGGALVSDGSLAAPMLARRRAGRWQAPLAPGASMRGLLGWSGPMVTSLVATDQGIVAGGYFGLAGGSRGWIRTPGAARWDGSRWIALGSQPQGSVSISTMTLHSGVLYAAGYFQLDTGYGAVARFDGSEWRLIGAYGEPFYNISCIASALGDLYVGGSAGYGDTDTLRGVARWDGIAWHGLAGGLTQGGYVADLVQLGSDLVACGNFTEMGGVKCLNVAAWSPARGWRPLGAGLEGYVYDLGERNGTLYAAGMFRIGGLVGGIARWTGTAWELVPGIYYASTIGWYRGRLVASGDGLRDHLVFLDDDGYWKPFGSGLNTPVRALVERGSSLFVGGSFSRAGGKAAYGFAEWREDAGPVATSPPRVTVAPNPSAEAVHLQYELAATGHARIEIFDLAGHRVERVFDGEQFAGPQDVVWTPGDRVRAGVYFAKLVTAGKSQVVRVVRIQ